MCEIYQSLRYVLYNMIMVNVYATQYSERSESIEALGPVCELLHIKPYRLGILLGMDGPHNVYRWFNGDVRPSQKYCIRIMRLMQMAALDGVKFHLVERIEWPAGKIIWKVDEWNDKGNNGVSSGKRAVSEGHSPYRVSMAELPD